MAQNTKIDKDYLHVVTHSINQ